MVSFYSFFSTVPRGKHLIRVCLGTACYVRGGMQVLEALKKKLGIDVGETTEDREFSLEVARCFGACGLAPAVTINDDVHHRVRAARIGQMLAPYYAPEEVSRECRRLTMPAPQDHAARPTCWPSRTRTQKEIALREDGYHVMVTVHMGTCGIASGSRDVLAALVDEIGHVRAPRRARDHLRLHRPLRAGADDDRRVARPAQGHLRRSRPPTRCTRSSRSTSSAASSSRSTSSATATRADSTRKHED